MHLHEMEHYYVPGVIENGKKMHLCGMKKTVNRNPFLALCDAGGGTMPRSLDDVNKLWWTMKSRQLPLLFNNHARIFQKNTSEFLSVYVG